MSEMHQEETTIRHRSLNQPNVPIMGANQNYYFTSVAFIRADAPDGAVA